MERLLGPLDLDGLEVIAMAEFATHCRWPLGTNLVECINKKIKVIRRMAYVYRHDAYFFLKIRTEFPGVGR